MTFQSIHDHLLKKYTGYNDPKPVLAPRAQYHDTRITDHGFEWARLSPDLTVVKLDLDAARHLQQAAMTARAHGPVSINTVLASLVVEAFRMGAESVTPTQRPTRVRDL